MSKITRRHILTARIILIIFISEFIMTDMTCVFAAGENTVCVDKTTENNIGIPEKGEESKWTDREKPDSASEEDGQSPCTEEECEKNSCTEEESASEQDSAADEMTETEEIYASDDTEADVTAPVIKSIEASDNFYAPASEYNVRYYGDYCKISAEIEEAGSGICRIEYCLGYDSSDNAQREWINAGSYEYDDGKYVITLNDGDYKNIAVRALDCDGNEGAAMVLQKDETPLSIIVDSGNPRIEAEMFCGAQIYNAGTQDYDIWTNKEITINAKALEGECPYAGIYKFQYMYLTAREAADALKSISGINTEIKTGINAEANALKETSDEPASITGEYYSFDVDRIADDRWKDMDIDGEKGKIVIGSDNETNKNGYFFFRAISKCGRKSREIVSRRVLLQQTITDDELLNISDVSTERHNGWYNKESGTPVLSFRYPKYDTGAKTGEYAAPIRVNYRLKREYSEGINNGNIITESSMSSEKGITSQAAFIRLCTDDGAGEGFCIDESDIENDIAQMNIDFRGSAPGGDIMDGIYTLEYWLSDAAGNESEHRVNEYRIDVHEPSDIMVEVGNEYLKLGNDNTIVYSHFFRNAVDGRVIPDFGISGKGYIKIMEAKNVGEWRTGDNFKDEESFRIEPCKRCFLYIECMDDAGNKTEGWTNALVVDDQEPQGELGQDLIIEPDGANEQGFFNKDIDVDIVITDTPDNNSCASIMTVDTRIGKEGVDTLNRNEFSFEKPNPTEEELMRATRFAKRLKIKAADNESNEAYIEVTAKDRCGNVKTATKILKIDVTKPVAEVIFDDMEESGKKGFNKKGFVKKGFSANEFNITKSDTKAFIDSEEPVHNFYNNIRTAGIHIREKNFDPGRVEVCVTRNGIEEKAELSEWSSEGIDHYAKLVFGEDGDYTMSVKCRDLADNEAEEINVDGFTIDLTAPVADISVKNEMQRPVDRYSSSAVAVGLSIKEKYFIQDNVKLEINGLSREIKSEWTHESDVHRASVGINKDGDYSLVYTYTDPAGNVGKSKAVEFTVDTLPPCIDIKGVADNSANKGEIHPVIRITDDNLDCGKTDVSIKNSEGNIISVKRSVEPVKDGESVGTVFELTDMGSKPDDVYYLCVTAEDKAGNMNKEEYRFSLNRNGSTYDISGISDVIDRYYNRYDNISDLRIIEMNVDRVKDSNLYITRNGDITESKKVADSNEAIRVIKRGGTAYTVSEEGNDDTGYSYTYTIYRENFEKEGLYGITFYSLDRAGNEVNNTLEKNGQPVSFVIDNTAPKIVVDGVEDNKLFNVMVRDNVKLKSALLYLELDGKELERWDYMELAPNEGDVVQIDISEYYKYDGNKTVRLEVSDAAGNEACTIHEEKTPLIGFINPDIKGVEKFREIGCDIKNSIKNSINKSVKSNKIINTGIIPEAKTNENDNEKKPFIPAAVIILSTVAVFLIIRKRSRHAPGDESGI